METFCLFNPIVFVNFMLYSFQVLVARLREFMEAKGEDLSMDSSAMDVEDEEVEEITPDTPTKVEPEVEIETPVKVATPVASPVKAAVPASPVKTATPVKADAPAEGEDAAMTEEAVTTNGGDKTEEVEAAPAAAAEKPAAEEAAAKGVKRKRNEDEPFVVVEDEPEIDESLLCLDWHNSDISLKIDKTSLMTAEPLHKDGWGFVW